MVTAPGATQVLDVPKPEVGPNDVLVKVRACGTCGSDALYISLGGLPPREGKMPLGHEPAREVVEAGTGVVVLGAAGGVGLAAVDVAVALGARVLAAASSLEKLELCRERGPEACVDYDREDLRIRIREITGKRGAQVVIDPVGGHTRSQRCAAWDGEALLSR
jgi:NADPH:quinone reductase-like Zn-dependent oxidoreductase